MDAHFIVGSVGYLRSGSNRSGSIAGGQGKGGLMDMQEMKRLRLRDWVIALLGLWMLVSPRVLHFAGGQSSEIWCAWLVGAAILLATAGSRFVVEIWGPWQDGTNALLGLWLMVAPWAMGFAGHMTARTNSIVVGSLVAVLAVLAGPFTLTSSIDVRCRGVSGGLYSLNERTVPYFSSPTYESL